MYKLMFAAAATLFTAGVAVAQEAPYTVMNGQVIYPSQMQWSAPMAVADDVDVYSGSASALPGSAVYDGQAQPGYASAQNTGIFVFDGENLNNDQDYSGK